MDTETYRTYAEWICAGRCVSKGEQANFYAVNPEGTQRRAVFTVEQTEDVHYDDLGDWDLVDAHELREAAKKPRAKIDFYTDQKLVSIWVGSNTNAIKWLKKNGYAFSPSGYRWSAHRDTADKIVEAFITKGYIVDYFVDGVQRDLVPAI